MKFYKFLKIFCLLVFVFFIQEFCKAAATRAMKWHPHKDYLALGGLGLDNGLIQLHLFNKDLNSLTFTSSRDYKNSITSGDHVNMTRWSHDGKYLAVGGSIGAWPWDITSSGANSFQIFGFNDANSLTGGPIATKSISGDVVNLDWLPTGSAYCIAIAGRNEPSGYGAAMTILSFGNEFSLHVTDSRRWNLLQEYSIDVKFHPSGDYIAYGGNRPSSGYELQIYSFDKANAKYVQGSPFARYNWGTPTSSEVRGLAWSPNGKYLVAQGGNPSDGYEFKVFKFINDSSLSQDEKLVLVDKKDLGTDGGSSAMQVEWSSCGNFIAAGIHNPYVYEFQVYSFDPAIEKLSDGPVAKYDRPYMVWAIGWSPDSRYVAFGEDGGSGTYSTKWTYYKGMGLTRYDGTTYNIYQDAHTILKNGDNAKGWVGFLGGITVSAGEGAKLNLELPLSTCLDLRTTGSIILDSDLVLDSNISLSSGGIIGLNGQALLLNGNLQVPANSTLIFDSSGVVDGQGHDLILGKYAQLLVDGGVTVTFKNMTIKNTLNTISCPPIRCMDWYSQACFDNVAFAFNDDWAFRNGQFFIHNDVNFTGTSKFSYRSVRPSYIEQHSNMIFSPNTTFEYYPSTIDNALIKMQDKTSSIIFDGSTLQTTHTGIRFTAGSLYFDNKVTLSSMDNTILTTLSYPPISQDYGDGDRIYSVSWSPDGKYLAVGGLEPTSLNELQVYQFNGSSLNLVAFQKYGDTINSVSWSPDGKYLAIGGSEPTSGYELQIYQFNGSSLNLVASQDYGNTIRSVSWSPDGKYLAIGGSEPTSGYELQVYQFNGSSLNLVTSQDYGYYIFSVSWSPDGKYLAIGGYIPTSGNELQIYQFNGSSLNLVTSQDYGDRIYSVSWSPDGKYLAIGGGTPTSGNELQIYQFNGSNLNLVASQDYGELIRSVSWSPDGKYLAIGGVGPTSGNELQIYQFNGSSLNLVASQDYGLDFGSSIYSVSWGPDGRYLAVGGLEPTSGNELQIYPVYYRFDTSPQGFVNGVILGNSTIGASQDLDVYLLAAARVGIYGKVLQDSVNSSWNFQSRDSYVSLDRYDSQFKITNANSVENWKKNQIVKSSQDNTMFLQDNQVWSINMDQFAPEETFEFMNNLVIPDGQLVELSANAVIDGQGHDLILGTYAQLLVDGGVTVTFKNMTIKNTLNTISCPPIRCMDWYSQACFDNVTFAFNDDWAFRNGQFFVHNDVNFKGTSKFSYRSVRPSYIEQYSNMIFSPNTTFEYYPSTTDNALIKMADKTSSIIFDGSTLQTTSTGIRLAKGSLYFDNKVTLSSMDNTILTALSYPPISQDYGNRINSVSWSPDGKYLAIGGPSLPSLNELQIYQFNGSSLNLVASQGYGNAIWSVSWSPDGKYLAIAGNFPRSGNELQIYQFNGSSLNLVTSQDYVSSIYSVSWSPDGKYLAIGGYIPTSGNELQVYQFSGSSLNLVTSQGYGNDIWSVSWSPDGKYLAIGGSEPTSFNELQIYQFSGSSLNLVAYQDYGTYIYSVSWSPDGKYLAIGGQGPTSFNELQIYQFNGSNLNLVAYQDYGDRIHSVSWSPDGKYLAIGGFAPTSFNELQIYQFNGSSLNLVTSQDYVSSIYSVSWSPDGKYLAIGGFLPTSGNELQVYPVYYRFDTSPQGFVNGVILGNSTIGASQDLDVYLLAAARVGIYGKVLQDSVNSSWNFQSRDSYVSLDRYDSQFKITNANSVENWKKQQIIKSSTPNTLFLQDNQVWGASSEQFAPQETFEFMGNLVIPENTVVTFLSNVVLDGRGYDLILGERSQFFVDLGITVTFKDMTIKNSLNSFGCPPILCAYDYGLNNFGTVCFDNVNIAFNEDWAFFYGRFFVHNDVEFAGTSKFTYYSMYPSYIASQSSLIFGPDTFFEFYPVLQNNSLIKMSDKTSSIFFDGSTLQTTSTGIRLTKGSLYFDNKVTLSSLANIVFSSFMTATHTFGSRSTTSFSWSPDGEYIGLANSGYSVEIYGFNNGSLNLITSLYYIAATSVDWSSDGHIAIGSGGLESLIYYFDGSSLSLTASTKYKRNTGFVSWSPAEKYLLLGNTSGEGQATEIYEFDGSSLIFTTSLWLPGTSAVGWHPSGNFLTVSDREATKLYQFNGSSLSYFTSYEGGEGMQALSWSPDGKFLAESDGNHVVVLSFFNSQLNFFAASTDGRSDIKFLSWSPDGKYVASGNSEEESDIWILRPYYMLLSDSAPISRDTRSISWHPDGNYLALGNVEAVSDIYSVGFSFDSSASQAVSNGIIFGDSSVGVSQDLDVYLLGGAKVDIYGKVWYDCVN